LFKILMFFMKWISTFQCSKRFTLYFMEVYFLFLFNGWLIHQKNVPSNNSSMHFWYKNNNSITLLLYKFTRLFGKQTFLFFLSQHFWACARYCLAIHKKPLNVIALGQTKSYNINQACQTGGPFACFVPPN